MSIFCLLWYWQFRFLKKCPSIIAKLINPLYRAYCVFLGVDIPYQTRIGKGFYISHPCGIVINENVIIGNNVRIRCNTCIGIDLKSNEAPIICDGVNVGANVVIIGGVKVGENSVIGAGSVVITDIPANSIAVGNPARVVKHLL